MQLRKGQIIEIDIKTLVFGGAGLGEFEGMKVFVKKAVPGDKVKASLTRIKKNFLEAELLEVMEESEDRVKPVCKYSGVCGGCSYQFYNYEKQLEMKQQQVIDSFERIGGYEQPPVQDVIPCDSPFYYRNKMEFSFGYDKDMNFSFGMHLPGRRYDILDLQECHLLSKKSAKLVNRVRDFVVRRGWKSYQYSCGLGFLRSMYIREGKRTGERMINLMTSDEFPEDLDEGLEEFVEILGEDASSIYWSTVISKRGQRKQIKEKLLKGSKVLCEKMLLENGDEMEFDILPQAFFQPNTLQAEKLYSEVLKAAYQGDNQPQNVFDLFCGTGTIGLFLAKHAEKVLGVEINESAVQAAKDNAKKNGVLNIDFYVGDVAKLLKELKEKPDLIVVDPPRAGLTEKMIKMISDFGCSRLIYVSCNPGTLARDCALLKEYGFTLKNVQPVDMFPHTYHIENVCLLER